MKSFNNTNLDELRKDLNAALKAVSKKHNILLDVGRMGYSTDEVRVALTATTIKTGEEGMSIDEKNYRAAQVFNTSLPKFGSKFDSIGVTYTICGYSNKARKYPVLGKNARGTVYKFTEAAVTK